MFLFRFKRYMRGKWELCEMKYIIKLSRECFMKNKNKYSARILFISERKKNPTISLIAYSIFNTSFTFFFFFNFKTWWCGISFMQEIIFAFFFYINNMIFKLQLLYMFYVTKILFQYLKYKLILIECIYK